MDFKHLMIDLTEWAFICNLLGELIEHINSYDKFKIMVSNDTCKNYRENKGIIKN